uniref:Uncharacterized protein n=1 Tax=Cacopsylla melanoneura TaxID=428564 RepID=A0A8D9FKX3_9HEMI
MLEKYRVVLVFTTLLIQQVLMLKADFTTISVSDAIADYYKKIKLCEENKNFNDSQSDIAIHSLNSLRDIGDHVSDQEELPNILIRTTYDKRLVPKVRRPAGYHRNILLNTSASPLPKVTRTAEVTSKRKTTTEVPSTKTTTEVSSTKTTRFEPTTVRMTSGDETTTWVTPWRITPYANYDSEHERAVQREFPHRKKMMDDIIQKHIRKLRNISSAISYSSESVPSSCECHAGNWSESYNFWEKWKQKQCKPKYLNLQYGLNSEGTEFRTTGEENDNSESSSREFKKKRKYLRGKLKRKGKAKEYSESYDTEHELHNGRKVYPQQMGHLQPMGYPQQIGYVPQMGYVPHLGYPPQMGYAPPMGYPPVMGHPYYPYPMPQYNQHAQYNNPTHVDALSKKLEELHNEIKELKRSTTTNMWEQYLKLKDKFETTTSALTKSREITTIQDRFHNYRKMEKQEPYFSKLVPNVENSYHRRPYRTDEMGGYANQNLRTRDYLYQRNLKDKEYSPVEYGTARRTWFSYQRYSRTEPQDIVTHITNYLYRKPSDHAQNAPQFNKLDQTIQVQRKIVDATGLTLLRRSYRVNITSVPPFINQSPVKQYMQYAKQTENINPASSIAPRVTFTRPVPAQTETTIFPIQSKTENDAEVYRKYKELYEFPDYNSEKRRILRAKEKAMKRKLYAARGAVYDEGNDYKYCTDLFIDYRDRPNFALHDAKLLHPPGNLLGHKMGDTLFAPPVIRFNYNPFEMKSFLK